MPESPEVQALADFLGEHAVGRVITGVELLEFRALKTRDRPLDTLVGARITGIRRFGKHLEVVLDGASLVVSFGRAGWARWNGEAAPDDAPVIVRFELSGPDGGGTASDGAVLELTDAGGWLSLGLSVVDDPLEVAAVAALGPDPLDPGFAAAALAPALSRRKQLKALLQEQDVLAGIGNAYSDEILHAARLDPLAHAAGLDAAARDRLVAHTIRVMRDAAAARHGIPPHRLKSAKVAAMRVHGRTGEACPVCGDAIRERATASTSWQYCPTCQTAGVVL